MTKIKGICKNVDECSLAEDKVVQLAEKSEFICSECGQPLSPADDDNNKGGGPNKKLLLLIIAAVTLIIIVICAVLFVGGNKEKTPKQQAQIDTTTQTKQTSVDSTSMEQATKDPAIVSSEPKSVSRPPQKTIEPISKSTNHSQSTNAISAQSKNQSSSAIYGRVNLGYGTYVGDLKNGKPHGHGTITYTSSHKIVSSKDFVANPGDSYEGEFRDGHPASIGLWHHDGETTGVKP
jgi:hypothetical protein